jgi:hypothetical protein
LIIFFQRVDHKFALPVTYLLEILKTVIAHELNDEQ